MGLNLGQGQGEYDQSWVFSSGGDTNEVQRGKPQPLLSYLQAQSGAVDSRGRNNLVHGPPASWTPPRQPSDFHLFYGCQRTKPWEIFVHTLLLDLLFPGTNN